MADGLSTKLQSYLSDFSLEFWLKIWHNYYLGDVVLISGEIRKSIFSLQKHFKQKKTLSDKVGFYHNDIHT